MSINNEREKDLIQFICDICDEHLIISHTVYYGSNSISFELFNVKSGTGMRMSTNRDDLRECPEPIYQQRKDAIKLDIINKLIRGVK